MYFGIAVLCPTFTMSGDKKEGKDTSKFVSSASGAKKNKSG